MTIKSTIVAIACLSVLSFAALPEIRITTKGNQNPDGNTGGGGGWGMPQATSYKYFAVDKIELTDPNNSRNDLTSNTTSGTVVDSIKVRGNSTAGQTKKPYRIKFKDSRPLFGKEAARSWVLLANYYDATFSLNAIAFELGKKMGLEFTNSSQMVDLYINGTYKGIYQLTEQIQSHKGRVDLKEKHNGWLVEFDYHPADADETYLKFTSSNYGLGTFVKAPELDPEPAANSGFNSQLNFVRDEVDGLVKKMAEGGFPTNGYRDLLDLESWAKYVLIQLFMDNFDFNSKAQKDGSNGGQLGSNYAYKIESCDRIKAGPLWDFDLAAGVLVNGFAKHYNAQANSTDAPIMPTHPNFSHAFYKRLWEDPVFKAKYKKAWTQYKSAFQAISANGGLIDNIKSQVESSINKCQNNQNCNQWANNSSYGSTAGALTSQTFNTEVTGLKNWWNARLTYADQQFQSLNESADITQTPPAACSAGSSSSKANTVSSSSANNWSVSSSATGSVGSSSSTTSTQVTLTCTDLQLTVEKGGTIAEPTLTCSNGSQATNPNWFGRPSGNTTWTQNPASTTTSYIIRVSATCGTVSGVEASCGTVFVGEAPSPIVPKTALVNIRVQAKGNAIVLENLPAGAKVELYNLQGKRIFSSGESLNRANRGSDNLRIPVQTKGMYVAKVSFGSDVKILRVPVM